MQKMSGMQTYYGGINNMIKIILKDRLNPYREETQAYETHSMVKARKFLMALQSVIIYTEWEIITRIG